MFDRLPTPFGLVRAGVAPDHPKIKSVIRIYEKTAAQPGFRFFGNVEVGTRHPASMSCASTTTRSSSPTAPRPTASSASPARTCPASHSATEFVAWYNGHPDFADREFDLDLRARRGDRQRQRRHRRRPHARPPRDELETTDTADHAIEALAESGVKEIVVLGRRGPAQAAFTNPEVRELGELTRRRRDHRPRRLRARRRSARTASTPRRPTRRTAATSRSSPSSPSASPRASRKRIELRFLLSPVEIQGDGKVEAIVLGKNELDATTTARSAPRDTGERETIECGLVLRSIGYRGVADRGRALRRAAAARSPTTRGRVIDPRRRAGPRPLRGRLDQARPQRRDRHQQEGRPGDRRQRCSRTSRRARARRREAGDRDAIEAAGRARADAVSFEGWQAIDAAEVAAGEPHGRPRVKFCDVEEMVEASRAKTAA